MSGPAAPSPAAGARYDFSALLTKAEQRVLQRPERWQWVSSIAKPDLKPLRRPEHLAWSQDHGHALPNRELFIALAGKAVMTHRNNVYQVVPGTVMLFDTWDWHDRDMPPYKAPSCHHLWIHIPNRHIVTSNICGVDDDGAFHNIELKFTSVHMAGLITDVWDQCMTKPQPQLEWAFLKSAITFMLFESASDWNQVELPNSHQQVIDSVCAYIDKNLDKDLSLERVARLSGYSAYFFHRMFRRYRKTPLHRYVTEARVSLAKELLASGHSVCSVSERVGIMPQSYFSSFFQKHTRFNPSRWREMHVVSRTQRKKPS